MRVQPDSTQLIKTPEFTDDDDKMIPSYLLPHSYRDHGQNYCR
jgi:hypothetical protein